MTTTFVGALRLSGMTASMVLDGSMTGDWFLAYVQQVLAPTLRPGDVVILDNLAAHKGAAVVVLNHTLFDAPSATAIWLISAPLEATDAEVGEAPFTVVERHGLAPPASMIAGLFGSGAKGALNRAFEKACPAQLCAASGALNRPS